VDNTIIFSISKICRNRSGIFRFAASQADNINVHVSAAPPSLEEVRQRAMSDNWNIHASKACMTDQDIHVHRNNIQKQLNLRVGAESKGGTWSDVPCHSNRPYFDCDVFTLFFLVSDKANLNA
jgi:hypothetical protein